MHLTHSCFFQCLLRENLKRIPRLGGYLKKSFPVPPRDNALPPCLTPTSLQSTLWAPERVLTKWWSSGLLSQNHLRSLSGNMYSQSLANWFLMSRDGSRKQVLQQASLVSFTITEDHKEVLRAGPCTSGTGPWKLGQMTLSGPILGLLN